ncbi:phosphatase PAP2 family protein [Brevundimonas sp.]|uniref:phosphatase PAP2 family protein n=1 Tax=Brevundimonas sp. TaxID=1871086 RepID=UPI003BABF4F7
MIPPPASTSPNALASFARRALALARTEIAALGALLVIAFGVMTFVEVADDMTEADGQAFDHSVLMAMRPYADDPGRPWGPWWLKEAADDITSLGGISVLGLFATIAVVFLVIQRKRLSALLLVAGLGVGVMLSEGLKSVFERERPPVAYQAVETINASFPSGHALLSAVFYLSLGVMLTRAFPQRRFKAFVLGVAILMTLLVGITRIYLAAHWASDVFAGWSVGAAWAMALWLISYAIDRHQRRHHAGLRDRPAPTEVDRVENDHG